MAARSLGINTGNGALFRDDVCFVGLENRYPSEPSSWINNYVNN